MHTNPNKVLAQNQLAIGEIIYILIYILKLFKFINVKQAFLSHDNTAKAATMFLGHISLQKCVLFETEILDLKHYIFGL